MNQITLNGKTVDLTLRQMTEDETEVLLSIMMAPSLAINAPYKDGPDDPPLPQTSIIIHQRLTWCGKTTTPAVLLWLGLTCNGNPGTAVLLAYILHKLVRTSEQKVYSQWVYRTKSACLRCGMHRKIARRRSRISWTIPSSSNCK